MTEVFRLEREYSTNTKSNKIVNYVHPQIVIIFVKIFSN